MAANNGNDRVARLEVYVAKLKQRLSGAIPPKHAKSEGSKAAFKMMLENDLKKTQDTISRLKGV